MPSPAGIAEQHCRDAATAATQLAGEVAALLRAGIAERGSASLVVSGGKSPVPFFHALRSQPLDWSRVVITLADERWVAPDSPDSNAHFLHEHLLREAAGAACFVGLKTEGATPEAGLSASTAALAAVLRPFDVVVLGMGEDGHTASLFPGMPGLAEALDPDGKAMLAAGIAPVAPQARISMTVASLLDARQIFLPIQGAAKLAVYREARANPAALRYPIASVLNQQCTPVAVQLIEA